MRILIRTAVPIVALSLGLAACSKQPEPTAASTSEVPTEIIAEPDAIGANDISSDEPASKDVIPPALRGRWGLVAADCTGPAGEAKGLLTVGADQLKFYESFAKLSEVKTASADEVTADFAFTGEGRSWNLQVELKSPDGGKTMIRKDTGPDAAPQPLIYTRCA